VSIKTNVSKSLAADTIRIPTQRDLSTSVRILNALVEKAQVWKTMLEKQYKKLNEFRNNLDSLSSDSALFEIPSDSAKILRYIVKLTLLNVETEPIDSTLDAALPKVQTLLTGFNFFIFSTLSEIEEVNALQQDLTTKSFSKELPYLWNAEPGRGPMKEIADLSWYKGKLAF